MSKEKNSDDDDFNELIQDLKFQNLLGNKHAYQKLDDHQIDDHQPDDYDIDEKIGIPKMFIKKTIDEFTKDLSKEREEKYAKEISEELSVDVGQFTFLRILYNSIDPKVKKQMNKLLRITTGENFATAQKSDVTYIVFDQKANVVGFAMISTYSPEKHFSVEGPYLYNFITDTSLKKEKRCGHALMSYIEEDLQKAGAQLINLDVVNGNIRAFKFFLTHRFKVIGKYEKLDLKNMNLYEIDKTVRKFQLSSQMKELQERRKVKSKAETISLDDSESNKKIKYISLSKKL